MNDFQNDAAFDGAKSPPPNVKSHEKVKDFIVKVILNSGGRTVDFFWNGVQLKVGDYCVVEEFGTTEFGKVSLSKRPHMPSCAKKSAHGKVLRKATEKDMELAAQLTEKEKSALVYCKEMVMDLGLKMNVSTVQYSFDEKKAVFYFTADNRVDFRELVKSLNNYMRIKVELRQVGVRDKARILGGCGPCGGQLCCSGFLSEFAPVSIKMAKNQFLALSPEKISGVCGRLLCCLSYENEVYKELQKKSPKLGKTVDTPDGKRGKVCQLNLLTGRLSISFEDGGRGDYEISQLAAGGQGASIPKKPAVQPFPQKAASSGDGPREQRRHRKPSEPKQPIAKEAKKPKDRSSPEKVNRESGGLKRPADTKGGVSSSTASGPASGAEKTGSRSSRRRSRRGRRRSE